jgi:FKBP-type peptidyl-prolyl cis-trans isomerase FkpA
MKKLFLFILSAITVICYLSCAKSSPNVPACVNKLPSDDSAALVNFAGDSIPLTHDSSGLFYHIIDSGNANKPVFSSNITVNYVGRLMTNKVFDSASNTNLNGAGLYLLIPGWQIGMPKIGVGGHIQLFIPSALAWGCTGYGPVPGNAPVYFDVKLLQVN